MALSFATTTERRRGYKAGTNLVGVTPAVPAAPVLGAITAQSGNVKRVAITTFPSSANYLTREVSLNGAAYVNAGAALPIGSTYFDVDVGSATSWSFRCKAGNSGGESASYSNIATSIIAYTPAASENFDAATVTPSFFNTYNYGAPSTDQAYGGSGKSEKCSVVTGQTDWGIAGSLPFRLGLGQEIWVRFRTFFPSGFSFKGLPHLKFMRIDQGDSASGGHGAHIDWYIQNVTGGTPANDSADVGNFNFIQENWQDWMYADAARPATGIVRGVWQTWNFYYLLGATPSTSRVRLWRDSTLICDSNARATLGAVGNFIGSSSDGNAQGIMLSTYWNGGAPRDQSAYFDDFEIATSNAPPTATDSGGRIWIGV